MSVRLDNRRMHVIRRLSLVAAGLWVALLLLVLFRPAQSDVSPRTGSPVLKNFSAVRADTGRIKITMADESYTLERRGEQWVMEETGGYPVRMDRLNTLAEGLETLTWGARRTSDPNRLSRLGLGDPTEGGNGVLVEVFASDGAKTAEMITGRRGDQLYARAPRENIAFQVNGELPPLYTHEAWLDLDIINIDASSISAVRMTDASGDSIYLTRPPGGSARSFTPAPPFQNDEIRSSLAVSTSALAISRFMPVDVKAESDLSGRPVARHISGTFDGLEIDLRAWREEDGYWATLRAVEAGEGARRARTINDKAQGWAFKLTEYDWREFAPDVSSLVSRAEPSEGVPPPPTDFQP
ncbi:DUF4340 domain-containing protein [Henriciella litoralis]|uniref:DUF4340 domain-containing protein n=1 Tax=Henriciella litoralis TaxID=568102 RepID=UPI000A052929|nr:DUF4340 domain-containing protein [Henriciella litoralis]